MSWIPVVTLDAARVRLGVSSDARWVRATQDSVAEFEPGANCVFLLPVMEVQLDEVLRRLREGLRAKALPEELLELFPLQDIVATGLESHSERWVRLALVWAEQVPASQNLIAALRKLVISGPTQRLRHAGQKLLARCAGPVTDAQKLKTILSAIFKRKGRDGCYTRLFENLEPSQKSDLLKAVSLEEGELPVIGSVEGPTEWLIITTEKIVWRLGGETQTLTVRDVWDATADFRKSVATARRKEVMRELQVETVSHERHTIEVEEGAPLMGVWNVLKNLGARNRRAV